MAKPAFDHLADAYARYRPVYPENVLAAVVERVPGSARGWVLDLGAGPGTLADALARRGWPVIAVDASLPMLSATRGPSRRVAALAERLPIHDAACVLITAAQAVHWFNPRCALAEAGRVLRPGGVVSLLFYRRCPHSAFTRALEAWIAAWNPAYRGEMAAQDWTAKLMATGAFRDPQTQTLDWAWRGPCETFAGCMATHSYLHGTVPATRRAEMIADLRRWVAEWSTDQHVAMPLKVEIHSAVRR